MAGYSEDIECPHCGYEHADYSHESRGSARGETIECYVCGWNEYNWAELWDEEDEDAPEEYEYIPEDGIVSLAKIVIPFVNDMDEEAIDNILLGRLIPSLLEEKNWYKLIGVIFGDITTEV